MLIKTLSLVYYPLLIHTAASLAFQRNPIPDRGIFDLLKFNISVNEEKLIQLLPLYNFTFITENYSHLPGCIDSISNAMLYNPDELFSDFIVIPALVDAIRNYSKFLSEFHSIRSSCIDPFQRSVGDIDTIKATTDVLFNKSVLLKLFHIERAFVRYIQNFQQLAMRINSVTLAITQQLLFFKEYIELLYKTITHPLIHLNTMQDYRNYIRDNKKQHRIMVHTFLECFPIILLKQVFNILILLFEDKPVFNPGEGTSKQTFDLEFAHKLVVKEEFKGYEIYKKFTNEGKELEETVGNLIFLLGNTKFYKEKEKEKNPRGWENKFIKESLELMTTISKQLYIIIVHF